MLIHATYFENLFVTSVNKSGSWMDFLSQAVKSSAAVFSTQAAEVLSQDRDFAHAHLPSSGCRRFSVIIKYLLINRFFIVYLLKFECFTNAMGNNIAFLYVARSPEEMVIPLLHFSFSFYEL